MVKLGRPGQEWSSSDPIAKLWYCKVQNGYACSIIYFNNQTQVQVASAGDYKHIITLSCQGRSQTQHL